MAKNRKIIENARRPLAQTSLFQASLVLLWLAPVGCRLRADSLAKKIFANQRPDEASLAHAVLADNQHHGLRVELCVADRPRVEVLEVGGFFQWQDLAPGTNKR